MIPLHDDNPTHITPFVTVGVIVVCSLVFLWQQSLPEREAIAALYSYGVVPVVLFGQDQLAPELYRIPAALSVLTSMFLHGGWMHLIGNMLYLWIFGNNIEDAMGHGRFIVFYALCGIAAALAQSYAAPGSQIPMIGASGAIAGVLGAYLLLHPRARVLTLFYFFIFFRRIRVPAVFILGGWFALQLFSATTGPADGGGVAWFAHVGGFVAGLVLIGLFKYPGVPFFGGGKQKGPWG